MRRVCVWGVGVGGGGDVCVDECERNNRRVIAMSPLEVHAQHGRWLVHGEPFVRNNLWGIARVCM